MEIGPFVDWGIRWQINQLNFFKSIYAHTSETYSWERIDETPKETKLSCLHRPSWLSEAVFQKLFHPSLLASFTVVLIVFTDNHKPLQGPIPTVTYIAGGFEESF